MRKADLELRKWCVNSVGYAGSYAERIELMQQVYEWVTQTGAWSHSGLAHRRVAIASGTKRKRRKAKR